MRKLNNAIGSGFLPLPTNIDTFPFTDLILAPWNAQIFISFADSVRGNDDNDGKTLATAKKSIQAALDSFPNDLKGHEAFVFVHPGTYTNSGSEAPIAIKNKNGTIRFNWLGLWANLGNSENTGNASAVWLANLLGGAAVLSNDQIIVKGKNVTNGDGAAFFTSWDQNFSLQIYIGSGNFSKPWDQPSAQYAYRWKFMQDEVDFSTSIWSIVSPFKAKLFSVDNPIEIDFTHAQRVGLSLICQSGRIDGIKFTSSILSAINTETQYYSGLVFIGPECTSDVLLCDVWFPSNGYHPDFKKTNDTVGWVVEGVRKFISFCDNSAAVVTIGSNMIYNQGVLPDANIPAIYFNNSKASLTYNSDKCTVVDTSIQPHYIKDAKTNFVKQFLSADVVKLGSNLVQQVHTSAIADADLRNKDVSFYLDEAVNKLKVKLKYSDGTVKSGEIALT